MNVLIFGLVGVNIFFIIYKKYKHKTNDIFENKLF